MLSLAGAGGMDNAASFQPVWAMMLAQQLMVVVLVLSLPATKAESDSGFERIATEDASKVQEETNHLLGDEDEEDEDEEADKSIYRRTPEQPSVHTVRTGR